ncbi:MAG: extracellular solute-binding protein [Nitrososphaeraceae archaeon]
MANFIKLSAIGILLLLILLSTVMSSSSSAPVAVKSSPQKKQVTLTAALVEPKPRWDMLLNSAMQKLQERHPDMNIQINYTVLPYDISRTKMLNSLGNRSSIDLVSLDQIWLGNFAERGYLTDLSDRARSWGRLSDWYQGNLDGNLYKGKVYGIWAWTDVRGIWYWKDLLNQAGIDPNSLTTWDGYIASAKKLNDALKKSQNIQGIGLDCGASLWYPYLWMLGGDIIKMKDGHPTKGSYWFPAYNSSAGLRAMQFIKDQINAGLKPIANSNLDTISFINRTYAVFIAGSWVPGEFPSNQISNIIQRVGFIPMYPVPKEGIQTTTVMGGWELSIPQSSKNKDLAWELITLMLEPDILASMLKETGYLPTQKSIGQGLPHTLNQTVPYYDKMVSMVQLGRGRPNIPEFAQIDDFITEAGKQVCHGIKEPKQALDDAAARSAKLLGW